MSFNGFPQGFHGILEDVKECLNVLMASNGLSNDFQRLFILGLYGEIPGLYKGVVPDNP